MKILFITHGADMMGANRCLLDLISGLEQNGVTPIVLLPEVGPLVKVLENQKVETIIEPYHNWAFTKYYKLSYWMQRIRASQNKRALPYLCDVISQHNVDIIYTNSSQTGIGAFIAEKLALPHVWHIREFGEKDYDLSFYKGRAYFNKWANKAAALISMSAAIEKETLQNVTAPKHIIHDGIILKNELTQIQPRQEKPNKPFTFLIIGAIHPTKGQLRAVKAFHLLTEKNHEVRLLIAGKGRKLYTQKIKSYIQKNNLSDKAEMLGYVTDPYAVHQKADAVLMCSKSEGMGRVTLEAMIFGNPVIGFNGGGTPELIEDGVDGFIYHTDEKELAEKMETLVNNPELAFKMGKAGRQKIEAKYTIEDFAKKVAGILKNVRDANLKNLSS